MNGEGKEIKCAEWPNGRKDGERPLGDGMGAQLSFLCLGVTSVLPQTWRNSTEHQKLRV